MTARVFAVSAVSARLAPGASPVEAAERAAIAAAWESAVAAKPKIFNGRILLGERVEIVGDRLEVTFRETAFATLIWLRTLPEGARPLFNVFGAAAVMSSDGAALLGRMAAHTANAGQVYFPCGTPDLGDVVGETVDIEGSIARELEEETGLSSPLVRATEERFVVMVGAMVAYVRRYDAALPAADLARRLADHAAAEPEAELDAFLLLRSADEAPSVAPPYVQPALEKLFGR